MISPWQSDGTIIDVVHIRSGSVDPLKDQRRIGALLRRAELRPSRLLPTSVLCVRKMLDPLPGMNWLEDEHVGVPMEWEQAATRQLDSMVAGAARPAFGAVARTSEAVLFMDRAELLACLAHDWVQGTVHRNWWWAGLLRHGHSDVVLKKEWLGSIEYVPAALEILAARGWAVAFLQKLPEETVAELLDAVALVFALPRVSGATDASALAKSKAESQEREQRSAQETAAAIEGERAPVRSVEPWLEWAPEAHVAGCSPLIRALFGQALTLRRAPAQARSLDFQMKVRSWLSARAAESYSSTTEVAVDGGGPSACSKGLLWCESHSADGSTDSSWSGVRTVDSELVDAPLEDVRTGTASLALTNGVEPGGSDSVVLNREVDRAVADATADPAEITPKNLRVGVASPETFAPTALGGIFFLLIVALHLNLYGDFSSPRDKGIGLDIWDFLSLLALVFIGDQSRDDAVWEVLAKLAGRKKEELAGRYFEPPENWRLPEEWLEPFPEAFAGKEVIRQGRVQMWHPAGFLLTDESLDPTADPGDDLARWLNCIVLYIRARLIRALGRDDAAEFLIRIPARIALTSTHVHIHYSLDRHPIEIRLAGLDLDPGWIPAAGRYVAYHFD
jgi:hypothetical protein